VPAVIVYVLYYNLFTVCRRWVASGVLASYLGSWWVHAVFLSVGYFLMRNDRQFLK
jgi:lipopolysaccharide export LptBFGC system permease protein LptF